MYDRVIKNFDELACTALRKDALEILEAGYRSILTPHVIEKKVFFRNNTLIVCDKEYSLLEYDRVFFVGIGKCAADAALSFEKIMGDRITDGVVIDVRGVALQRMKSHVGTHPLPSEQNVEATRLIKEMLEQTTERDLVIAFISGGGSALLCLPHDLKCVKLAEITEALMHKGATIHELNIVRKHTSDIQGGQFARLAYPAHVLGIIFSDVPGNDLSVIASGPTVKDVSTKEDAERILAKYDVLNVCELPHCEIIETPKDDIYFEHVENILLLTNETALRAMKRRAEELGYQGEIVTAQFQGEARESGKEFLQRAVSRACKLYGGETTVKVNNKSGKGGRCQELVAGALPFLDDETVIVAASSDGWDNSDVAGALGDKESYKQIQEKHLELETFLNDNNSYNVFSLIGGHIKTGRTGVNVSDIYFILKK